METVQLQCGNCGKVMAISTEHLGGQVRCPHCLSVVQTPPRSAPAPLPVSVPAPPPPPVLEIMAPPVEAGEVESIFSPEPPSEDLFDTGQPRLLVEMPPEPKPMQPPREAKTDNELQPTMLDSSDVHADGAPMPPADTPSVEADADFTRLKRVPRPVLDRGYWFLMVIVFLLPYSVMMTLFVLYLWYQLMSQGHPLENLPDPVPDKKKDGAREVQRIKHDQPLPERLKVSLGKTLRVGEIEVTPVKVEYTDLHDLDLVLRIKNISQNQAFSPMHGDFLKTVQGARAANPYTFLDSRVKRFYGGHLAFKRIGAEEFSGGDLRPGQEVDLVLTTKDKAAAEKIMAGSNEDLTWRVQLRRGLVPYGGQKVSVTAVIGVQFNAKEIVKVGA